MVALRTSRSFCTGLNERANSGPTLLALTDNSSGGCRMPGPLGFHNHSKLNNI